MIYLIILEDQYLMILIRMIYSSFLEIENRTGRS